MAGKRYSNEDCLKLLREIELKLASGSDVSSACRAAGISDATYYAWRKKFGSMGRSQLAELKALEKENQRLKKIVADLELDKLILKESLDFLKPKT
jgi:transposase-like protein